MDFNARRFGPVHAASKPTSSSVPGMMTVTIRLVPFHQLQISRLVSAGRLPCRVQSLCQEHMDSRPKGGHMVD